MCLEEIQQRKNKYRKEFENHMTDFFERGMYRKEEQTHQQEPQKLKHEIQQEKHKNLLQKPQGFRKEADLTAGGAAQPPWTPANHPETGFAGQE